MNTKNQNQQILVSKENVFLKQHLKFHVLWNKFFNKIFFYCLSGEIPFILSMYLQHQLLSKSLTRQASDWILLKKQIAQFDEEYRWSQVLVFFQIFVQNLNIEDKTLAYEDYEIIQAVRITNVNVKT